jgi:hypothetical protein
MLTLDASRGELTFRRFTRPSGLRNCVGDTMSDMTYNLCKQSAPSSIVAQANAWPPVKPFPYLKDLLSKTKPVDCLELPFRDVQFI